MIEKGAKHLVLLSRNAKVSDQKTKRWLKSLDQRRVKVIVEACDVSDARALAASLKKLESHIPPFKGVIQAAMVLQVSHFLWSSENLADTLRRTFFSRR